MDEMQKRQAAFLAFLIVPLLCWFVTAKSVYGFSPETVRYELPFLIKHTFKLWPLWSAMIAGEVVTTIGVIIAFRVNKRPFKGAKFEKFYRGTEVVTTVDLSKKTIEKGKRQITIAGVPIPTEAENTHISIGGSTGTGKSTIFKEIMVGCLKRGDRMVVLDPDGEFLSNFYKEGDKILNPYDARSEGWSFFNEIRADYDFKRYSASIIQRSGSADSEEWNDYGRLLFTEVAKKVFATSRNPQMEEVFDWTNRKPSEELEEYVKGTNAQALFTGNSKASASARFVLSNKLPPHLEMKKGKFSLRDWIADPNGGNLFITWDENMRASLVPLISCLTDTIFSSVLGMSADLDRRMWVFLDELESLALLPTLGDALTKGRKKGLRVVSGYQTYTQVVDVYGENLAETMLGNHRTMVALGVGRMGEKTAEKMSRALGQHEIMRHRTGTSRKAFGGLGTNSQNEEIKPESVVLASELMRLPNLEGYLAFPGDLPIARFKAESIIYKRKNFVPGIVTLDGEILGAH